MSNERRVGLTESFLVRRVALLNARTEFLGELRAGRRMDAVKPAEIARYVKGRPEGKRPLAIIARALARVCTEDCGRAAYLACKDGCAISLTRGQLRIGKDSPEASEGAAAAFLLGNSWRKDKEV